MLKYMKSTEGQLYLYIILPAIYSQFVNGHAAALPEAGFFKTKKKKISLNVYIVFESTTL